MELLLKNIHPRDYTLLVNLAKRFGIQIEEKVAAEGAYNQEFVAKIRESKQQIREGKGVKVSVDDLWS